MLVIGWFGLPRNADVTRYAASPTDYALSTLHSAVGHFYAAFPFDHSMSGVNVKNIFQHVVGRQIIVESYKSKIHKSTALE